MLVRHLIKCEVDYKFFCQLNTIYTSFLKLVIERLLGVKRYVFPDNQKQRNDIALHTTSRLLYCYILSVKQMQYRILTYSVVIIIDAPVSSLNFGFSLLFVVFSENLIMNLYALFR